MRISVIERVAAAEDIPLEDQSVDLITSALSIIWFADQKRFYDQVFIYSALYTCYQLRLRIVADTVRCLSGLS